MSALIDLVAVRSRKQSVYDAPARVKANSEGVPGPSSVTASVSSVIVTDPAVLAGSDIAEAALVLRNYPLIGRLFP
jgi:hypothetical protein